MAETEVPYHSGFLLGVAVDLRTMKAGLIPCEEQYSLSSKPGQQASLISQFSCIETLRDVCDVLSIPPEYAVKAKDGVVKNEVVKACLKDLGRTDVLTFVFRTCYVQQKMCLPNDSAPQSSMAAQESCDSSAKTDQHATHWVKAVEIGDEQIIVMKISSKDTDELDELKGKIDKCLEASTGKLDDKKLKALRKAAGKIDKRLSKPLFKDAVNLEIHYGYFHELCKYPADMSGMVDTLESFIVQCMGWKETSAAGSPYVPKSHTMMCKVGVGEPLKGSKQVVAQVTSSPQNFYIMRATLKSFHEDTQQEGKDSLGSHAPGAYTNDSFKMFEKLCKFLQDCVDATKLFQDFQRKKSFLLEDRTEDANGILKKIELIHANAHQAVESLDFVHHPTSDTFLKLQASNPLETAKEFIQKVTSKLPSGTDIDLLMIGKTGHGKSATGNSILGESAFYSSHNSQSVTSEPEVKWKKIDGRTIKVVDTPGVCDTNFSSKEKFMTHAVKALTDAIVVCPEGFDALLVVISCQVRITAEEIGAIQLLKNVLGEEIIKSHCVFIFTHGDQFEGGNFNSWCKEQDGGLRKLLEECQYRCVLFNNKTTDPVEKKEQLIQLVAKVDSLRTKYPRYTNEIFDIAQKEREKILAVDRKKQLTEKIMKELQLLIGDLKESEKTQNKGELKKRLDSIKHEIAENKVEDVALKDLISLIEKEDDHAKKLEAATKLCKKMEKDNKKVNQQVASKVETHVHQSSGGGCFPGSSTVMLADGKRITLDKLQVGDKVLVRDNTGALVFDTVYMFGHQEFDTSIEYKILGTALCDVFVSQDHLVYCMKDGKEQCIAAEKICVGDNILVATLDGLKAHHVVNITYQKKSGLFAPFTLSGTIVVDDALMSCYIDVLPATTAHRLLWPMRQLYRVSPRALAFVNGSTSEHPVPRWVNTALKYI